MYFSFGIFGRKAGIDKPHKTVSERRPISFAYGASATVVRDGISRK